MQSAIRNSVVIVWTGLLLATLISWWVGTDHGFSAAEAATISVIAVAFIKVRFVGLYFMELRNSPTWLRGILEGYTLVVATALIVMYLVL